MKITIERLEQYKNNRIYSSNDKLLMNKDILVKNSKKILSTKNEKSAAAQNINGDDFVSRSITKAINKSQSIFSKVVGNAAIKVSSIYSEVSTSAIKVIVNNVPTGITQTATHVSNSLGGGFNSIINTSSNITNIVSSSITNIISLSNQTTALMGQINNIIGTLGSLGKNSQVLVNAISGAFTTLGATTTVALLSSVLNQSGGNITESIKKLNSQIEEISEKVEDKDGKIIAKVVADKLNSVVKKILNKELDVNDRKAVQKELIYDTILKIASETNKEIIAPTIKLLSESGFEIDKNILALYDKDFNRSPVIKTTNSTFLENSTTGKNVITAYDPEGETTTITMNEHYKFYYIDGQVFLKNPNDEILNDEVYVLTFNISDGDKFITSKVTINLKAVNDLPEITILSNTGQEKQKIASSFLTNDVDGTVESISIFDPSGLFKLEGSNIILKDLYRQIYNPETYTIRLSIMDNNGGENIKNVIITLLPDNDPITIIFKHNNINEKDLYAGEIILNDPENQIITVSIDNNKFEIINNKIYYTENRQFLEDETFSILITAIDNEGLITEYTVSLIIKSINDAPIILNEEIYNIDENTQYISELFINDPENDIITYKLLDSSNTFKIENNMIVPIDINREILEYETYNITLVATDIHGLISEKEITIILQPVNDIPNTIVNDSNGKEKIEYITDIIIEDKDSTNHTIILENDYDIFKIVDNKILLIDPYRQISEIENYELKVIVNDNNGGITSTIINIQLNIDNDAPIITVSGGTYQEEIENVGSYNIDDPENDLTETILENDYGIFRLHNGKILLDTNYEVLINETYILKIITTDIHNTTSESIIEVILNPKNDIPIVYGTVYNSDENSVHKIADFNIYDKDNDTFTVKLIDDSGKFILIGNEIFLKNPGQDLISDIITTLNVEISDGDNIIYHDINVNVSKVNDPIDSISITNKIIPYNYTGVISFLQINEKDQQDFYTYSINDNRFSIIDGLIIINDGSIFDGGIIPVEITVFDSGNNSKTEIFNFSAITPNVAIDPDTGEQIDPSMFRIINGIMFIANNNMNENYNGFVGKIIPLTLGIDNINYNIISNNFTIDQNGNVYTSKVNYELEDILLFEITVSNDVDSKTAIFNMNINDVNEEIENVNIDIYNSDENNLNYIVATFNVVEEDKNDTYNYVLLNNTDKFKFVSNNLITKQFINYEHNNTFDIDIRIYDEANHYIDRTITININDVNEKPTDIIIHNTFNENDDINKELNISIIDEDEYNIYDITLLNYNEIFQVLNNKLVLMSHLNYDIQNQYNLSLQVFDGENTFIKNIILNIENFNYMPSDILLDNIIINENYIGIVGTLTSLDIDKNELFTYEIVDNNKFNINGDKLYIITPLNYEETQIQNLKIKVTDSGGNVYIKDFIINVNDINEKPIIIENNTINIQENKNGIITKINAFDPDNNILSYSIISGTSLFSINNDGYILTNGLDYEYENVYNLTIRVHDGSIFTDVIQQINVLNVNEKPNLNITIDSIINENQNNIIIGTYTIYDPDNNFSNIVVSDPRLTFNNGNIILNTLLDYEQILNGIINVSATAYDMNGLTDDVSFSFNVSNINETPYRTHDNILYMDSNDKTLGYNDPDGDNLSITSNLESIFNFSSIGQISIVDNAKINVTVYKYDDHVQKLYGLINGSNKLLLDTSSYNTQGVYTKQISLSDLQLSTSFTYWNSQEGFNTRSRATTQSGDNITYRFDDGPSDPRGGDLMIEFQNIYRPILYIDDGNINIQDNAIIYI